MHQIHALTVYNITVTAIRHVLAEQFHHQEVHSKPKTIHSELNHIYVLSVHPAVKTTVNVDKICEFPAFCDTTWHSGIEYMIMYTGCPRRNVPEFGRVYLMLKYAVTTQNTYIQSWTVMELMGIESNRDWVTEATLSGWLRMCSAAANVRSRNAVLDSTLVSYTNVFMWPQR